ncbi:hypothetical protein ACH3XW_2670 [Acanthocheilonema viteae]
MYYKLALFLDSGTTSENGHKKSLAKICQAILGENSNEVADVWHALFLGILSKNPYLSNYFLMRMAEVFYKVAEIYGRNENVPNEPVNFIKNLHLFIKRPCDTDDKEVVKSGCEVPNQYHSLGYS